MKFCSSCGERVTHKIPADDNRLRHVCEACGVIHYENPRNVVGTIPVWENRILLCKRAIEPRLGYWTLPAGFLEIGESTTTGARRETEEEAGAQVEIGPLFSLLNVAHIGQVHMFYLAQMNSPEFSAGIESLEVELFEEHEIPWDDLAFPTVKKTLRWFFEDRASGKLNLDQHFVAHHLDLEPRPTPPHD
jgi:ADP-ribose pyrophosphatase YjhB (NUDIX family)